MVLLFSWLANGMGLFLWTLAVIVTHSSRQKTALYLERKGEGVVETFAVFCCTLFFLAMALLIKGVNKQSE